MTYWAAIYCWLVGIWRTIRRGTWLYNNTVAGHKYHETEEEGQPDCIQILECKRCHNRSIAWWRQ